MGNMRSSASSRSISSCSAVYCPDRSSSSMKVRAASMACGAGEAPGAAMQASGLHGYAGHETQVPPRGAAPPIQLPQAMGAPSSPSSWPSDPCTACCLPSGSDLRHQERYQ